MISHGPLVRVSIRVGKGAQKAAYLSFRDGYTHLQTACSGQATFGNQSVGVLGRPNLFWSRLREKSGLLKAEYV